MLWLEMPSVWAICLSIIRIRPVSVMSVVSKATTLNTMDAVWNHQVFTLAFSHKFYCSQYYKLYAHHLNHWIKGKIISIFFIYRHTLLYMMIGDTVWQPVWSIHGTHIICKWLKITVFVVKIKTCFGSIKWFNQQDSMENKTWNLLELISINWNIQFTYIHAYTYSNLTCAIGIYLYLIQFDSNWK